MRAHCKLRRCLRGQRPSALVPGAVATLATLAWCGFASGFHRSTPGAVSTWAVSLCAVGGVDVLLSVGRRRGGGWHVRPSGDAWPPPGAGAAGGGRRVLGGISPWIGLALLAVAWDVLGLDTGPGEPHLTISALAQAFRPLDAALLLVWILLGVGYGVVRARVPALPPPTGSAPSGRQPPGAQPPGGELQPPGRQPPQPPGRQPPNLPPDAGAAPALVPGLLLPASRPVGVAFWLGVVALGALLDATARRSDGRIANAEQLLRLLSGSSLARLALVAAWGYAGWHLFAY